MFFPQASVEQDDLPHPDAIAQPVEALVDLLELQAVGEQLVDRQAAGAEEGDHARHVALRSGRADIGAFQGPLLGDQRERRELIRLSGWGRPAVTVMPPRAVTA